MENKIFIARIEEIKSKLDADVTFIKVHFSDDVVQGPHAILQNKSNAEKFGSIFAKRGATLEQVERALPVGMDVSAFYEFTEEPVKYSADGVNSRGEAYKAGDIIPRNFVIKLK